MTVIVQPTIDRARTLVESERHLLETERDAFRDLLSRVATIQPDSPGSTQFSTGGTATVATAVPREPSHSLRQLTTAYRETIMAVPHYDEAYGESLPENLAVECGEPLAGRLLEADVLTPTVYAGFLDACREARTERERTLGYVDRELASLRRCGDELAEIESAGVDAGARIASASGTQTLSRIDDRLATLESRCERLIAERQQRVHDRSETDIDRIDGLGFLEYLYADLDTTTPVLVDAADCLDTIRSHRCRCLR